MASDRRLARGGLSELGEVVQEAKRRALAVRDVEPVKEVVDGEQWIFVVRSPSKPAGKRRRR